MKIYLMTKVIVIIISIIIQVMTINPTNIIKGSYEEAQDRMKKKIPKNLNERMNIHNITKQIIILLKM